MNLPSVVSELVRTQNNYDSVAYAQCFSETAIVLDEGKMHKGRTAIKNWIEKANQKYKTVINPLEYSQAEEVLKAEISGDFDGSPIVLNYHFTLTDGLIQSLKING